jgi:hypothetical protein
LAAELAAVDLERAAERRAEAQRRLDQRAAAEQAQRDAEDADQKRQEAAIAAYQAEVAEINAERERLRANVAAARVWVHTWQGMNEQDGARAIHALLTLCVDGADNLHRSLLARPNCGIRGDQTIGAQSLMGMEV